MTEIGTLNTGFFHPGALCSSKLSHAAEQREPSKTALGFGDHHQRSFDKLGHHIHRPRGLGPIAEIDNRFHSLPVKSPVKQTALGERCLFPGLK